MDPDQSVPPKRRRSRSKKQPWFRLHLSGLALMGLAICTGLAISGHSDNVAMAVSAIVAACCGAHAFANQDDG